MTPAARPSSRRRGSRGAARGRRRASAAPAPPFEEQPQLDGQPVFEAQPTPEPDAVPEPVTEATAPDESGPPPDVELATPEAALAERVPEPEAPRALPPNRRAIFFDVENTSRAEHIARVIDHLAIDRMGQRTDFFAVGNWRVIGHDTARLLARHGAQLLHSAPSLGVRDWSDLRIAVTAGVWLASARAGDVLEIVSDDRAFDAVGDVAASLGIAYRRLSSRALMGGRAAAAPPPVAAERVEAAATDGHRRHRRGGRGRRTDWHPRAAAAPPPPRPMPAARAQHHGGAGAQPASEPHTAPHDEIVNVVRDLVRLTPGRNVTLDLLANALKSRGFSRPPGSPRLITRLRRIKELDVNRAGVITLVEPGGETVAPAIVVEPEPVESTVEMEAPEPGNEREPVPATSEDGGRRRRTRRGGRRRRPRTSHARAGSSG